MPFKSGENSSPIFENPNTTLKIIVTPVAKIRAVIAGRRAESAAFTTFNFKRFLKIAAMKSITKNDGRITPIVATSAPKNPPTDEPTKVATFTARGPGVDSATATKSRNAASVSQPFVITVSFMSAIIPKPPPNETAPILRKLRKRLR